MVQGKAFRRNQVEATGTTAEVKGEAATLDILTAMVVANREAPFDHEVVLAVNGRLLQELITGVDEPESWVGPPFDRIEPPSGHLLGGENEWGADASPSFPDGKVAVLACSCGYPECGAVFTKISVMPDVVTWSDMECFKRPGADMSSLPGFTFNAANYLATVGGLHQPASLNGGAHVRHGSVGPRQGAHWSGKSA